MTRITDERAEALLNLCRENGLINPDYREFEDVLLDRNYDKAEIGRLKRSVAELDVKLFERCGHLVTAKACIASLEAERDAGKAEIEKLCGSVLELAGRASSLDAERDELRKKVEAQFVAGMKRAAEVAESRRNTASWGSEYYCAVACVQKDILSAAGALEQESAIPQIQTCVKCGTKAVAFICSERGCPVNGGAAYEQDKDPSQ